jgi:hypothetical protein
MFCLACEGNYWLKVYSEHKFARKKQWSWLWFSIVILGFNYYVNLGWILILSLFILFFFVSKFSNSFVTISEGHETKVIREFKPIGVRFD